MNNNITLRLSELVYALSATVELANGLLTGHHRQVLGFSAKIADALRVGCQEKSNICVAAMLHDIGIVAFNSEIVPCEEDSINFHAEFGYRLMKRFAPFAAAAELVRYHHAHWEKGREAGAGVPLGSSIIHLADWVAVKMDAGKCPLTQAAAIQRWVIDESNGMFMPEVIEAFLQESARESFWLDARFNSTPRIETASSGTLNLDMAGLRDLSDIFRMSIDYRSRHTAAHSISVANIAETLARLHGFSGNGCSMIHVAGNLHDLGKLALPYSILDKIGSLSVEERNIVKAHPYHTYKILSGIDGFGEITAWAAFHHECPDGSGYPFRLCDDEIPLGARIVAIADIFSALTETRPYRCGMPKEECLRNMRARVTDRKLDLQLFSLLEKYFADLYDLQLSVQRDEMRKYEEFILDEAMPFIHGAPRRELLPTQLYCG